MMRERAMAKATWTWPRIRSSSSSAIARPAIRGPKVTFLGIDYAKNEDLSGWLGFDIYERPVSLGSVTHQLLGAVGAEQKVLDGMISAHAVVERRMATQLQKQLLAMTDSSLDASMKPLIEKWNAPATALEILEVLDKCIFSSLAAGDVIAGLQILYRRALEREGVTHEETIDQATWRKDESNG